MKSIAVRVLTFSLLFLIAGCSTLSDVQHSKGTGTSKVYDKPYDVVWNTVVDDVKKLGLVVVFTNKESGNILANSPTSAFSAGGNVAVFVEDLGGKVKTRVEVVSKRVLATNLLAPNWEKRIFADLDKQL